MTKKQTPLSEFDSLTENEQLKLLRKDGVYVGKLKKESRVLVLFQLYSFYVEIYYTQYRKNITHISVSESVSALQPYLDQLELKGWDVRKK